MFYPSLVMIYDLSHLQHHIIPFSSLKKVIHVVQGNNIIIIDIKYPHSAPPLRILFCHCSRLLSHPLLYRKGKMNVEQRQSLPEGFREQKNDHVSQCILLLPNVCMTEIFKKLTTLAISLFFCLF